MKKFLLYYFTFLFSSMIFLSSGVIDSQDGFQYLAVARNIYYNGEPTAPVYEYDKEKNIHMSTFVGKDGKTYSPTGLGYSLALVPAVALTDVVYKLYNVSPPIHFPLESDWLVLMLASFTNGFFTAALGVIIFLYFILLKVSKLHSLFLSLTTIFATNLLVYGKHSFAHMMFITFLVLSFFLLKKYSLSKKKVFLLLSGTSFGIVTLVYNPTFLLSIPVFVIYYFLLLKPKLSIDSLKKTLLDALIFLAGTLPLIITYFWFEAVRAAKPQDFTSSAQLGSYASNLMNNLPISVFIEGLYGQLFSPGRSIFLYSPILLVIILFWHKMRRTILPELIIFVILFFIYVSFYAAQYSIGRPDQGIAGFWHGESSWGPRYLTPIIPFGMLLIGYIYQKLSKLEKRFVFYPLIAIGLYVQLLGTSMPYQIKFHDLQREVYFSGTEYTSYVYSNFLPRFSPVFKMSQKLVKLSLNLPKTLDHGAYNVRYYDGVDFPFNVGIERWRTINTKGYISFDNLPNNPVSKMSFGVINHPVADSSASAQLMFSLNGKPLLSDPKVVKVTERSLIEIPIEEKLLQPKNNQLIIDVDYEDKNVISGKSQILGLISLHINNVAINKESIDFPYLSSLGSTMAGIKYQNYGALSQDPWLSWHIHTQIYERVPDFWWAKSLYYWDLPKNFFLTLFLTNILIIAFSCYKLVKLRKTIK